MKEPASGRAGVEQEEKNREAGAVGERDSEASGGVAKAKSYERPVLVQDPFFPSDGWRFERQHGG